MGSLTNCLGPVVAFKNFMMMRFSQNCASEVTFVRLACTVG